MRTIQLVQSIKKQLIQSLLDIIIQVILLTYELYQNTQMQIPSCPVLYPTPEQFNDFYHYVHQLDNNYKNTHGMVKIVPPSGWIPQSTNYQLKLDNLIVKNPIEQNVQGSGGFFQSKNMVQDKMTLKNYRKYAERESKTVEDKTASEKQKLFWKTITYSPPIYGADLTGTLMDQNAKAWNFNTLNSLLKYALPEKVKGVTEPYCYIGSWKAFFSWHKEDLDLAAINYIHEGASKIWYSIAKCDSHILQSQARGHYKEQSRKCSQFLRHKTFLIKPELLLREHPELKISRVEHKAGEIMIVFGGAYHSGFNCGFNIAEAVNYATIDWLKQLTQVKFCKCFRKSVRGEIESILYNLENSPIYGELCKSQQFVALQNFVLDLQRRERQFCEQVKEQRENVNTNIQKCSVAYDRDQKELVNLKAKNKESKKIKKEQSKMKKENEQQYRPSYKCSTSKERAAKTKKSEFSSKAKRIAHEKQQMSQILHYGGQMDQQ